LGALNARESQPHRRNRVSIPVRQLPSDVPAYESLEPRILLSASPGTWTTLTNNIPDPNGADGTPGGAQTMVLLSDGTVMVHGGGGFNSANWYQLKPDSTGSYVTGTWSRLASMSLAREFSPAAVLPSGKLFVLGGEYTGPNLQPATPTENNTGEIYDPITNSWTNITDFPQPQFGDGPIEVLPDGKVLAGSIFGPETFIYDPISNSWSSTGAKQHLDASSEETWIKLPDDSILSYDVSSSANAGVGHAQRYIPSQAQWVDAGTPPALLSTANVGFELGPGFLLPDGRVFLLGAVNAATAFYTPSMNTWTAGRSIPGGFVCADAPGAMLPNGDVLFAASPQGTANSNGTGYTFPPPTKIFEFDPIAGTYTDVTPTNFDVSGNSFSCEMLVLPTGQVMFVNDSRSIALYTPTGSPNDAWRPTISDVTAGSNAVTITGMQLNGLSEGAAYGDDNEMASNYPIVRLRDPSGNVFYARTFDWSSTGVATGSTPVTVQFTLPSGAPPGRYGVTVIANGIASAEFQTDIPGLQISDVSELEGDIGLTDFVFTVTQSANAKSATVEYATADGSATVADNDYVAQSGTLTFAPGQTSQQITIEVVGDTTAEPDETFFVNLSDPQGASLVRAQGVGTILNDDVDFSINDATALEGDVGTSNMVFTVSVVGVSQLPVAVTYATNDGTAHAGSDYVAESGILEIPAGAAIPSFKITVPIIGDTLSESNEAFFVDLNSLAIATIARSPGVGTIIDDDPLPVLVVDDVHVTTTHAGEIDAVFAVALNVPSGQDVTVQYATADGSAKANTNYLATSGTLDFPAGVTKQLVTVPVLTGGVPAPNETFSLNLFNPFHAGILDAQGVATIIFAEPPAGDIIIDDGEAGYNQTAGWINSSNTLAYHLDYDYHAPGNGGDMATWTFANLVAEQYQVFVRWAPFSNRATNAPYLVFDGLTPEGTVRVNQQLAPSGDISDGITWTSIGTFNASSGNLTVELNDNANGYVTADAVRIVPLAAPLQGQAPEMDVAGFSQSIADGAMAPAVDDGTDFGNVVAVTNSATHTFTISNTGNADLHLSGSPRVKILGIPGANSQDFTVVTQPSATVAAGATTTFQVLFYPAAIGLSQAIISIDNDDASEHPYTFEIQGTGIALTSASHNAAIPQDVNGDHAVTDSDLLLVINRLISQSATSVSSVTALGATGAAPAGSGGNSYFCDVNGDGNISPSDALMIINYLLQHAKPPSALTATASSAQAPISSSTANPAGAAQLAAVDQVHGQLGATTEAVIPTSALSAVPSAVAAATTSPPLAPTASASAWYSLWSPFRRRS
jgi:hypothetical protein